MIRNQEKLSRLLVKMDANRGAAVSKLHEQSLAPVTELELSVVRFK